MTIINKISVSEILCHRDGRVGKNLNKNKQNCSQSAHELRQAVPT